MEAEHILNHGELKTYWEGTERDFLMSIRRGILTYDELNKYAESKLAELKVAYEKSSLPEQVNMKKINVLYAYLSKDSAFN